MINQPKSIKTGGFFPQSTCSAYSQQLLLLQLLSFLLGLKRNYAMPEENREYFRFRPGLMGIHSGFSVFLIGHQSFEDNSFPLR